MSSEVYYRSWMDKPHLDPNTSSEFTDGHIRRNLPTNLVRRNLPRNTLRRKCPRNVLRRYVVFPMNSGLVYPHRNIVGSSSE
ncbi:hypothetical protein DY000_02011423 [Brassica cretica]|uniref:Uncharacterized protein n=1 Tax=Brassica cretica TaxID=69181 RepID=A0ABQ7DAH0_BRACR|nr:hypothetical protein DY000_02011423 [Brassica cretica]